MSQIEIEAVPCLKDNYAYVIARSDSADCYVVDPSEAEPVLAALERRELTLRGILATHHHADHVGGVSDLLARAGGGRVGVGIFVGGHALDRGRIPEQTAFVEASVGRFAPSGLRLFGRPLLAMHIPGHTRAAIAWGICDSGETPEDIFTGDTLFGAGCGRLFEGTPEQMYTSLRSLTALPDSARLWFGHEYTESNLRFAATVEPASAAIKERQAALRPSTTPTTVGLELATNPFVRSASVEDLAARRKAKDSF
ncbi:MAG TPA: hydroxyacylglutathione hydrolase [Polyangia bacterium]|nr:hydroxyacylglutathione hydrolase [Polyangia bacterium]